MPDLEEEEDVRGPGELDARLANSNESRELGCRLVYVGIVSDVSRSMRRWAWFRSWDYVVATMAGGSWKALAW